MEFCSVPVLRTPSSTLAPPLLAQSQRDHVLKQAFSSFFAPIPHPADSGTDVFRARQPKAIRFQAQVSTLPATDLLSQLQMETATLLDTLQTPFPAAFYRSYLIATNNEGALAPLPELQKQIQSDSTLNAVKNTVQSEACAYLLTHIAALEKFIHTPQQVTPLPTDISTALLLGIDDARAMAFPKASKTVYGKAQLPIPDDIYDLILASPKVTLHEHYKGGVPIPMVRSMLMKAQDPLSIDSYADLQEECRVDRLYTPTGEGPLYNPSLSRFLKNSRHRVSAAINSPETAYLSAYLFALRLGVENVRYFEYRLNPFSRSAKNPLDYVRVIQQGLEDAQSYLLKTRGQKIDFNLILTAVRSSKAQGEGTVNANIQYALKTLETAIIARKNGLKVTGFDIAGDEEGYAITDFKPVADMLKAWNRTALTNWKDGKWKEDLRIGATIHAGETTRSGVQSHPDSPLRGEESIEEAIKLFYDEDTLEDKLTQQALRFLHRIAPKLTDNPTLQMHTKRVIHHLSNLITTLTGHEVSTVYTPLRIGHGTRIIYAPHLVELCRKKGIGLEQCPKSNVQTGAVPYYTAHPALALSRYGLKVSISSDNRTISKSDTCNELVKCTVHLGATQQDREQFQLNGIDTAFIFNPKLKQTIRQEIQNGYQAIKTNPFYRNALQSTAMLEQTAS